jgi:hypothetical protein
MFPRPKMAGRIQRIINDYLSGDQGDIRTKSKIMQLDWDLIDVDKWMIDNISKLFINTGATFHTLLLLPVSKKMMRHYEYKSIPTTSENILRKIARHTGGIVEQTLDTAKFLDKISKREDIYYMISYVPERNEPKNSIVTVKIVNPPDNRCRLVYDNKRKPRHFRNVLEKLKKNNPEIKIRQISLNGHLLSVRVANINIGYAAEPEKSEPGMITAAVTIMDKNSKIAWETQKIYKSKKSESIFQTKIPHLEKGNYTVIVEVKDLASRKTVTLNKNVKI